jgi:hypothetical protein
MQGPSGQNPEFFENFQTAPLPEFPQSCYAADMNSTARTVLLVILILLLIGLLPTWGYSSGWGYYPSGGVGLLVVVLVILLVLGKI